MRLSFRTKTVLGIALIEAFFLSILIFNSIRILASSHESELNYRVSTLARVFADAVSDAVLSYDIATLNSLAEGILNSPEVVMVSVSDTQSVLFEKEKTKVSIQKYPNFPNVTGTSEIKVDGRVYGQVSIIIDGSQVNEVIHEATEQSIRIALIEIIFVAIASLILGSYLTSQLARLKNEIKNFHTGEASIEKMPGNIPKDDIGDTLKAFFEMKNELSLLISEREGMLAEMTQLAADNLQKESWLKAIINQLTDGVLAFDVQGTIHYVNKPAQEMLGFVNQPVVGLTVFDLSLSEIQKKRVRDFIQNGSKRNKRESLTRHRNEVLVREDGTSITSSITMTYLHVDDQDYFIMTLGELSWRQQVEREMAMGDAIRAGILESSLSAIIAIDENDRILEFNASAEKIFGYSRNELIGESMAERIMPERFREQHLMGMKKYINTGEGPVLRKRIEIVALDRELKEFPIELAVTPIATAEGHIFTAVIDDISQRKQDNENLRLAKESAIRANEEKSRFLASMSHEIRTPLNVVLGMVDLIQGTDLSKQQREFLINAENAGRNLLDMINDVLDLSKIEAGRMEPKNGNFNPVETFEQTVALFKQRCWSKELRLHAYVEENLPESIFSDVTFFRQILTNLLANAINYTDKGAVTARLNASKVNALMHLKVEVSDTGVGLSQEAQNQLFEEFTQVHESTPKRTKGTGLGLVICRQLANLVGGDISVSSEEGKGSTFTFELPMQGETPQQSTPILEGQTFVIWSQDLGLTNVLESQLQTWGALVKLASVEISTHELHEANAVIIDTTSLGSENIERGIGNIEMLNKSVPLYCLVEADRVAMQCNRIEPIFLQWPFQTQSVKTIMNSGHLANNSPTELVKSVSVTKQLKSDYSALKGRQILLVDDSPANRLITSTYLESVGCNVAEAEDGLDALEQLKSHQFDAILMDMRMPRMGGVEATEAIRERRLAEQTPIIALTAHAMAEVRDQCLAVGMQDFLTKPIEKEVLFKTLTRCVTQASEGLWKSEFSTEDNVVSSETEAEMPVFNEAAINKLAEETSRAAVAKMLNVFFKETRRREVLIRTAIEEESVSDLEVSVHALKSSSITFGAEKLSQLCKIAETECREGDSNEAFHKSENILPLIEQTREQMKQALATWWVPDES